MIKLKLGHLQFANVSRKINSLIHQRTHRKIWINFKDLTTNFTSWAALWIRIGFNADQDPALYLNADLDTDQAY